MVNKKTIKILLVFCLGVGFLGAKGMILPKKGNMLPGNFIKGIVALSKAHWQAISLENACYRNDTENIKRILSKCDKEIFNKYYLFDYALRWACSHNNLQALQLILSKCDKKSVNEVHKKGSRMGVHTPFYYACCKNNCRMAQLLLSILLPHIAKKEVNSYNVSNGFTGLLRACYKNNPDMVTLLLPFCTKETINRANKVGDTPLCWACFYDNQAMVANLLFSGAEIDDKVVNISLKKPKVKKLILTVLEYCQAKDKLKYIDNMNQDTESERFLVGVILIYVFTKYADTYKKNRYKSYKATTFYKLYKDACFENPEKNVFDFTKKHISKYSPSCRGYLSRSLVNKQEYLSILDKSRINKNYIDCVVSTVK